MTILPIRRRGDDTSPCLSDAKMHAESEIGSVVSVAPGSNRQGGDSKHQKSYYAYIRSTAGCYANDASEATGSRALRVAKVKRKDASSQVSQGNANEAAKAHRQPLFNPCEEVATSWLTKQKASRRESRWCY